MQTPRRQTSTLAAVSLTMGILSWIVLPVVGCIAAIVTGHLARAEIRREPERLEGRGLAAAGLILGWLNLLVCVAVAMLLLWLFGAMDFMRWPAR